MQRQKPDGRSGLAFLALCCGLSTGPAWAANPKEPKSALDLKEFSRPELYISSSNLSLEHALPQLANRAQWEAFLAQRGEDTVQAFIDPRSGAVTNLQQALPLIPGSGAGNTVTLAGLTRRLGKPVKSVDASVVEAVLRAPPPGAP